MSYDPELSDYLLGELDPAARARFEARMAGDPRLRAEVERLAPAVTRLEQVPTPAWEQFAPLGAAAPGASAPDPSAVRRERRLPALAPRAWAATALAALALLGAGVGIGVLIDSNGGAGQVAPSGGVIALAPLGSAPASASASARMTAHDRMRLTVESLPPAPAGSYYEAWLLDGPGNVIPVAAFSVGADGRAVLEVPLPADASRYRYLDVSLQHVDDGTRHSGDSVLRGALS